MKRHQSTTIACLMAAPSVSAQYMILNARSLGGESRPPLIILHGLLGSTRNWQTVGKLLSEHFEVHALDLRNHGESPWQATMSYTELATDITNWMDSQGIAKATLMGHSLGGKVAMKVALEAPERLTQLIVVDIAPKTYPHAWLDEIKALMELQPHELESRQAAEEALTQTVPDWALRKFLLTNLARDEATGHLRWQSNLRVIYDNLPALFLSPLSADATIATPSLFIHGEKSNYVTPEDERKIAGQFPHSKQVTIANAGHNVHFDQPAAFVQAVLAEASTTTA